MKQFEKQFEIANQGCEIADNICDKIGTCDACRLVQEIAWRAALECLQDQVDFGTTVAYSDADVLTAIKKYIKEELES